jgi:hypothetical protein
MTGRGANGLVAIPATGFRYDDVNGVFGEKVHGRFFRARARRVRLGVRDGRMSGLYFHAQGQGWHGHGPGRGMFLTCCDLV